MIAAVALSVGALLAGYLVLALLTEGNPPTGPSLIVLSLFVYGILPQGIQVFQTGRFRLAASIIELPSELAQQTSRVMVYVVLMVAGAVVVSGLVADNLRLPRWLLIFAAPWITLTISAYANYHTFSIASVAYILAGVAVALAPKAMATLPTIGHLTAMLGVISICMAVFYPSIAFFHVSSNTDKALLGNGLLAGPLLHPNTLGQMLALGSPFLLAIPNEVIRRSSYVAVAIALPLSGSRTSMIAIVVGLLAYGTLRLYACGKRWPYLILACATFLVGPYLVWTSSAQSFTSRGIIWSVSLAWWERQPWVGQGPKFYREKADAASSDLPSIAYHGHSIFVNVLTVAGIVGLLGLMVLLVSAVRNAPLFVGEPSGYGIAIFPLIFIADGWLEMPTDFYTLGSMGWVVWVVFALLCKGPSRLPPLDSETARPKYVGETRSIAKAPSRTSP